ncbi:hypothetical protein [Cyclobacterium sp. SYSU L10401]|uniref:hypothetical protein n=1 Tax=Cyclobacterium sp. SYSU L10401 TaxID=2678657 RepID=UPI0013D10ECD|nr:hypothetical protein [Cyclobacterium sp. SYSU L10401]
MKRLEITSDYSNVDWDEVIPVLMSYAYVLVGASNQRMARSREELAYDFAVDAITKYLDEPEKFDPSRNPDLIKYLKYNILRQLISNAKKKASNVNEVVQGDDESEKFDSEIVDDLFAEEFELDEAIDVASVVVKIEQEIEDDEELYEIFVGRYCYESKRGEICKDLKISTDEYDNRIRRLRRLSRKILDSVK